MKQMKKSMMIAMSALLLGFSTSAMAAPRATAKAGAGMGPGMGAGMRAGMGAGMGMQGGGCKMAMMDELGLSDKQYEQLDELRAKHMRAASAEHRKLWKIEQDLQAETAKEQPDNNKIAALADEAGKQYAVVARMKYTHMTEMNALLTPAQRDAMKNMTNNRPMRGRGGCSMMGGNW